MESIKARFSVLDGARSSLLDRARECSSLTLPYILPPDDHDESESFPTPYQSVGARGVNSIASKMTLGLLPPNAPFFRLGILDGGLTTDISEEDADVQKQLYKIESIAGKKMVDELLLRNTIFTATQHAAITGNACVFIGKNSSKVIPFDRWVAQRDGEGNLVELIIKEVFTFETLPKKWQEKLLRKDKVRKNEEGKFVKITDGLSDNSNKIEVYTRATWSPERKRWLLQEEVEGIRDKTKEITKEQFPFFVIRWHSVAGEHYGRGIIEQYLGSLIALEALEKALVTGAIQSSRVLWLLSPESVLKPKDIEKAFDGDVLVGNATDVAAIQLNKYADFQWIMSQKATLEENLARDFLMLNGVIRDAERVTAEEIRAITQELENTLGGVYSLFSRELLLPLAKHLIYRTLDTYIPEAKGQIEELNIQIITGLNAVGRGEDFNRLATYLNIIQAIPEAAQFLNMRELLDRLAVSVGIESGIVKTEEQLQQEQQMAQMAQLATMLPQLQQQLGGGEAQGA